MKKLISLLFCVIFFVSCSEDVDVSGTTGTITGSVADKTTGEPIAVANVTLSPSGKTTVTGYDGTFEFQDIEEGSYVIKITKNGYKESTKTVAVVADAIVESHLLIERIPAIITADCNELDFGDKLTTAAFSIVNDSYETLEWHIEYDAKNTWISGVKPNEGKLNPGKTAAIVVTIDRDKLKGGNNESILVVVSNNGKHEIKATAIGEDRILPELNILPLTDKDITSNSAILYGEITNPGTPKYIERGFVYSKEHNPTLENTIDKFTAPTSENPNFSCKVDNLELGGTYYFRAFARNSVGVAYSSNEEKVTTFATPPTVIVNATTGINVVDASATLNGEVTNVGDPHYKEKGFVYGLESNPTLDDYREVVGGTELGKFYIQVSNLERDKKYYVRSYIINSQGTYYSDNEITFTVATTLPKVSVTDATNLNVANKTVTLNGVVNTEGVPAYTIRGFVYGLASNPKLSDNSVEAIGTGVGEYSCKVSNLEINKTYYVRAYATNAGGTVYSEEQKIFTLSTQGASVVIKDVTNINIDASSAVLNAEIIDAGTPAYNERGFVYNTSGNPSLFDEKVTAQGDGIGTYASKITNLKLNTTYYVRAYVINEHGTVYSTEQKSFSLNTTSPALSVDKIADINYSTKSAVFHGSMSNVGNPKFSERGFVYGIVANPNIYGDKLVASSSGDTFSMSITNLKVNTKYYVRCYAIQNDDVYYSDNEMSFTISATLPEVSSLSISNIDYETKSALFTANIDSVGDPAVSEKGFVYSATTNPNIYDDYKISSINKDLGAYSLTAKELSPGVTYHVRAYALNEGGVAYSDEQTFSLSYTEPQFGAVYVDENNIDEGYAIVRSSVTVEGNPRYIERGFVYATHDLPTIADNHITVTGSGVNSFSGKLENLDLDKRYYVRAYVKTEVGYYYAKQTYFSTTSSRPLLSVNFSSLDLINKTVVLEGELSYLGNPTCYERGFVYSESNSSPTIYDNKVVVDGMDTEQYTYLLENLNLESVYYVRAYAISRAGVYYSDAAPVSTTQRLYEVTTAVTNENAGTRSALFAGKITYVGTPNYTEVGFVYSTTSTTPTINDTKCVSKDVTNNMFTFNATNLPSSGPVYVRAYAINQKGVAYANNVVVIFDPSFLIYDGYVEIPSLGIAVVYDDLGSTNWDAAKTLCSGLRYGNYTGWRLPTLSELSALVPHEKRLGLSGEYWSSTSYNNLQAYTYGFGYYDYKGQEIYDKSQIRDVVAVRTLSK